MKAVLISVLLIATGCVNRRGPATPNKKIMENKLPKIGVLIFDGFLTNEVCAPFDVFTKKDLVGQSLFDVYLVARSHEVVTSEEGIRVVPDYSMEDCPPLDVLIVPSSNHPDDLVSDEKMIDFIKIQNVNTQYTASHCAGAFALGASGIADGNKLVTYFGGGEKLQREYPEILVQNDSLHAVVRDGKFFSSNGNLVSYLASLELLEQMSGADQRRRVENELLIHKLCNDEYSGFHHEK